VTRLRLAWYRNQATVRFFARCLASGALGQGRSGRDRDDIAASRRGLPAAFSAPCQPPHPRAFLEGLAAAGRVLATLLASQLRLSARLAVHPAPAYELTAKDLGTLGAGAI